MKRHYFVKHAMITLRLKHNTVKQTISIVSLHRKYCLLVRQLQNKKSNEIAAED